MTDHHADTHSHVSTKPHIHHTRASRAVEGSDRVKAFSDAVIAIVMTLLILELHVPDIHVLGGAIMNASQSNVAVWNALVDIFPKLAGFAVSFLTIAIFWVNHHHFFHSIEKTDGALLWYNNFLLFWLAVIPFVTAFVGDYPTVPLVVALYGFALCMGAFAFLLMARYVFFHSELLPASVSHATRLREFRHTWPGVIAYGVSVLAAFVSPYISLALFILIPIYYFVPNRVEVGE